MDGNNYFAVFLPPNHDRVHSNFQRFFNGGVFQRWYKEMIEWTYSPRVQDRLMYRSPVKVVERGNDMRVISLKMGNRMRKLFTLWAMCCLVSFVVLVIEVMKQVATKLLLIHASIIKASLFKLIYAYYMASNRLKKYLRNL